MFESFDMNTLAVGDTIKFRYVGDYNNLIGGYKKLLILSIDRNDRDERVYSVIYSIGNNNITCDEGMLYRDIKKFAVSINNPLIDLELI